MMMIIDHCDLATKETARVDFFVLVFYSFQNHSCRPAGLKTNSGICSVLTFSFFAFHREHLFFFFSTQRRAHAPMGNSQGKAAPPVPCDPRTGYTFAQPAARQQITIVDPPPPLRERAGGAQNKKHPPAFQSADCCDGGSDHCTAPPAQSYYCRTVRAAATKGEAAWVDYAAYTAQHTANEDPVWRLVVRTSPFLSAISIAAIPLYAADEFQGEVNMSAGDWRLHRRLKDLKHDVGVVTLRNSMEACVETHAFFSLANAPLEQRRRLRLSEGAAHVVAVEIEPVTRVLRVRVDDYSLEGTIAEDAGIGPDMPIVWGVGVHSPGGEVTLLS
jgi:hypothetical protein